LPVVIEIEGMRQSNHRCQTNDRAALKVWNGGHAFVGGGISMGGYGTWHLASKYLRKFAAIAQSAEEFATAPRSDTVRLQRKSGKLQSGSSTAKGDPTVSVAE